MAVIYINAEEHCSNLKRFNTCIITIFLSDVNTVFAVFYSDFHFRLRFCFSPASAHGRMDTPTAPARIIAFLPPHQALNDHSARLPRLRPSQKKRSVLRCVSLPHDGGSPQFPCRLMCRLKPPICQKLAASILSGVFCRLRVQAHCGDNSLTSSQHDNCTPADCPIRRT